MYRRWSSWNWRLDPASSRTLVAPNGWSRSSRGDRQQARFHPYTPPRWTLTGRVRWLTQCTGQPPSLQCVRATEALPPTPSSDSSETSARPSCGSRTSSCRQSIAFSVSSREHDSTSPRPPQPSRRRKCLPLRPREQTRNRNTPEPEPFTTRHENFNANSDDFVQNRPLLYPCP
jgi:hypothetical protein